MIRTKKAHPQRERNLGITGEGRKRKVEGLPLVGITMSIGAEEMKELT